MNTKTVTVIVPGTSANCGPGFDSLGVACTIYNELKLTLTTEEILDIKVTGEGASFIPTGSTNVVWTSIQTLLKKAGVRKYRGCIIRMENHVPLSRGLGSSATAIVAGIAAANALIDSPFNKHELLEIATEIEGHPDNVAPAIYGGFTVSVVDKGVPYCLSFKPEMPIKLVVVVPDFHLSTKAARAVLPETVKMSDAVFNLSRAAMLPIALCQGNAEYMRHTFEDRLHQPYRAKLIPGMYEVFEAAKEVGALGASLSGAGPCLIAYTMENEEAVGISMVEAFKIFDVQAKALHLDVDTQGVRVLEPVYEEFQK